MPAGSPGKQWAGGMAAPRGPQMQQMRPQMGMPGIAPGMTQPMMSQAMQAGMNPAMAQVNTQPSVPFNACHSTSLHTREAFSDSDDHHLLSSVCYHLILILMQWTTSVVCSAKQSHNLKISQSHISGAFVVLCVGSFQC